MYLSFIYMRSLLIYPFIIAQLLLQQQAKACSCEDILSTEEAIKHSDIVLTGTILNKITEPKEAGKHIIVARYTLLVDVFYKGNIAQDTVIISTGISSASCGIRFETGKKYIIYGYNRTTQLEQLADVTLKNTIQTNICTRTELFNQTEIDEIERFAMPKQPYMIMKDPELQPRFKGGDMKEFIRNNIRTISPPVTGTVWVTVSLDTAGSVIERKIKKGLTEEANEEALRIVKMMTFTAAELNRKPVESKLNIPVKFE